jgi:hypothetical protein
VHLPISGYERPHALLRLVAVTAQCSFAGVLRRIGKHAGQQGNWKPGRPLSRSPS